MTETVRLLTWNVWGRGGDWQARQPAIDSTLTAVRPDVLALQETWRTADAWPQVARIADLLDYHVAVAHPSTTQPGDFDLAVLSRWPIRERRLHPLPVADSPPGDDRLALEVDIATPAGTLPICTTHLSWQLDQSHIRQAQVHALASTTTPPTPERLPRVLCGDFNAEPTSDEIRMLTGHTRVPVAGIVFQDAWQAAGDGSAGHTWSHRNPEAAKGRFGDCRLDYVFVQWHGRGCILRTEVIEGDRPDGVWASDHFGVFTELDLAALADRPGPV
jgi:endonuclease/exonuclease/phosphatase family metal-dependent hydrolase